MANTFETTPKQDLSILTLTAAATYILVKAFPIYMLAQFCSLQFHELGHATAAWISGRFAMPLFYGETVWSLNKLWPAVIFSTGVCLGLSFFLYKKKYYFATGVLTLYSLLQLTLTIRLDEASVERFMIAGGILGEAILTGFCIVLYNVRFPLKLRWDFWRFPVLFFSFLSFWCRYQMWDAISKGISTLPVGSLLGGSDDRHGDINRLIQSGYTQEGLIEMMNHIFHLVLLIMVTQSLIFAVYKYGFKE